MNHVTLIPVLEPKDADIAEHALSILDGSYIEDGVSMERWRENQKPLLVEVATRLGKTLLFKVSSKIYSFRK